MSTNGKIASLPVRQSLEGKHIVVTGFTGFVGKVWSVMALDKIEHVRLTAIVRGRRGCSAQQRVNKIVETSPAFRPLRQRYGADLPQFLATRLFVIEGDVTHPRCGAFDLADVASADLVVNFAGVTDFEPDPLSALAVNVDGALHAADLTTRTAGRRLLHVSTTFVAGNLKHTEPQPIAETITRGQAPNGLGFDPEAELHELRRELSLCAGRQRRIDLANARALRLGWPNIYTYTKGLSEHLLALHRDRTQAKPIALHMARPSVVESARHYPFPGWNEGINTSGPLVWLLASSFRRFPSRPKHRFDVVPVDTVARGLFAMCANALVTDAAASSAEQGDVMHLSSSGINPFTFGRAIDLTALAARRMHRTPGTSDFDRWITRQLDAVPIDADAQHLLTPTNLKRVAKSARHWLRKFDLQRQLPPALYERGGGRLEERLRSWAGAARSMERKMGMIEELLRLYRPFIHDNDYVFGADAISQLSDRIAKEDAADFRFDIDQLDWREYWLDVHVPGLERWCLPLLRGEKIEQDPAPSWRMPTEAALGQEEGSEVSNALGTEQTRATA